MYSFFRDSFADVMKRCLNKAISDAVNEYKEDNKGCPEFSRDRELTMDKMLKLMLTMQGGCLQKELHEANIDASPSAFVQRRKKLDLSVFESVLEYFNLQCDDKKKFKGYRVFAVDGTTVNMARDVNAETYMKPTKKNSLGFNQMHVTPLYDVLNKTYKTAILQAQPKQDEIGALMQLLTLLDDTINEKTLIVGDRGFESYNTVAFFLEHSDNFDFLIRVKQGINAMKAISELPMEEQDTFVEFTLTTTQRKEDKANGNIYINNHKNKNRKYISRGRRWDYGEKYRMKFRVVRVLLITGEYETLITSLPTSITADEIKELYHSRWGVETAFRELKSLKLWMVHSKSILGVSQEIYCSMIFSNFASRIINEVVVENSEENILTYQVNRKMGMLLAKEFFRDPFAEGATLMKKIASYTEPVRPGRSDSRKGLKAQSFKSFVYRSPA